MACEKEIWQKIGEGFVQEYYNQFDNTNRMGLGNLYVSFPDVYSVPSRWMLKIFWAYSYERKNVSAVSWCLSDVGRITFSGERSYNWQTSSKYLVLAGCWSDMHKEIP